MATLRDKLRYILDQKEVYGEDFPGETFRVLKEIKQFGGTGRDVSFWMRGILCNDEGGRMIYD